MYDESKHKKKNVNKLILENGIILIKYNFKEAGGKV